MDVGDKNAVAVLDLVVKAVVKVVVARCYPPVRLAHALGRIAVFVNGFLKEDRETCSAACMDLRRWYVFRLALDLRVGAGGRTLRWTSGHPNLLRLPVNLGVVLAKPGKTEDHGLLAQRGDCELSLLCMAFVAQYDICDFGDGSCFVRGSVDVVDGDGRGEATGGDVVRTDVLSVDEKPGGTAVDERTGVALHRSVRRLNFNFDIKGVVTWGRCDDEFLWQTTLPVSKPNSRCFWGRRRGLWHDFHTIEYACSILTLIYY